MSDEIASLRARGDRTMTTTHSITDKQLRQWRAALERARHDLAFLSGAVVTDRIDLIDQELAWRIDNREVIAELDAALSEFSDTGSATGNPG